MTCPGTVNQHRYPPCHGKPFFQPQLLLQWCKVILIPPSSCPLSPGDHQSKQSQKLAVIYCGHHPQANQQLKNEPLWPHFTDQGTTGPFQVKSKQRAVALGLFKCPPLTHVPLMSNFSKITDDTIHVQLMQPAIFFSSFFPQSAAWFVILKIGHIFALQKQLSLLLSSRELSSSRQAELLFFLLLFLAEKYLTQLWTKAKRIYSPLSLFATCGGIVRMINSTVQFSGLEHFNSFFNCLWKQCQVYISPSPGTQVPGKIITLSSLSSSSSSSSSMSSTTCRQKQKSFSCP